MTPGGVGISKLTLTVEAPDGVFTSTQVSYGVSEYEGGPSDRYYSGAADAGTAIDVGEGYMIVGAGRIEHPEPLSRADLGTARQDLRLRQRASLRRDAK